MGYLNVKCTKKFLERKADRIMSGLGSERDLFSIASKQGNPTNYSEAYAMAKKQIVKELRASCKRKWISWSASLEGSLDQSDTESVSSSLIGEAARALIIARNASVRMFLIQKSGELTTVTVGVTSST